MWLTLEKQIFHQRQTLLELSSCQSSTSELPVWFVSSLEFCAYWLLFKFWLLCLRFANNQTSWSLLIADVQEGLGYPGHAECNPIIPHAKWWISHHLEFWKMLNHLPFIYLKHDIIDHQALGNCSRLERHHTTGGLSPAFNCAFALTLKVLKKFPIFFNSAKIYWLPPTYVPFVPFLAKFADLW